MTFKYSSLLVSSLVLATFVTSTVNADDTNNVVNGNQLTITKNFNLSDGMLSPKADFTFTVSPATPQPKEEKDGLEVFAGITTGLGESKVSYDNSSTTNNKTKTAIVDFSGVHYPQPGIYRYTIKENTGAVPGVSYDTTGYTVDVYVLAHTDTSNNVTYIPQYIVSHDSTKTAKEPVVFNNGLQTTSLKVRKEVSGNAGDRNKEFTFSINLNDTADSKTYESGSVEMTITKKNGASSKIQVPVTNTLTEFKLKDGESATIDKLPIGIHYSVNEEAAGYTQSASINKDTSKTTITDYKLGDDELSSGTAAEIVVKNKKDSTTPTGVSMTIVPYVGLTIIALGGVLYVLKKRKA